MCKDALLSSGDPALSQRAALAYALSIVALIGTPILLVGGIAWRVIRAARRIPRAIDTTTASRYTQPNSS
ncbi:MAG: hypothetical protein HYY15_00840 [Candidatus Omnitrophica bacterium]|nr:hypothetical protein [Candidatus Omnitrophota bacterium]